MSSLEPVEEPSLSSRRPDERTDKRTHKLRWGATSSGRNNFVDTVPPPLGHQAVYLSLGSLVEHRLLFLVLESTIAKNYDYSGKSRVTVSNLSCVIHHWLFCLLYTDYLRIQNLGYCSCIICQHWSIIIAVYSKFMLVYLNTYKASKTQGTPWNSKYPGFCWKWRQNSAITQGNPGLPGVFSLMLVEYKNNLPKIP